MYEFSEGDTAWMTVVFTKTQKKDKCTALVMRVTIEKIFEDGSILVTDSENVGMYIDKHELVLCKEQAVLIAMYGLEKWADQEII